MKDLLVMVIKFPFFWVLGLTIVILSPLILICGYAVDIKVRKDV